MIDIENAKIEFNKFINGYDKENQGIQNKISHSYRVMENSKHIAKSLDLENDLYELAIVIGLLHDIGRFEEVRIFNDGTFSKKDNFDHGDEGVLILKKDNYIDNFTNCEEYKSIILTSIKNHNKFKIEDDLNEKELIFSKILRDADKLDILIETRDWNFTIEEKNIIENSVITDSCYRDFVNNQPVYIESDFSMLDLNLAYIGFIFDLNYKYSFEFIRNENIIDRFFNKFNFKNLDTINKIIQIKNILNNYINEQINNQ